MCIFQSYLYAFCVCVCGFFWDRILPCGSRWSWTYSPDRPQTPPQCLSLPSAGTADVHSYMLYFKNYFFLSKLRSILTYVADLFQSVSYFNFWKFLLVKYSTTCLLPQNSWKLRLKYCQFERRLVTYWGTVSNQEQSVGDTAQCKGLGFYPQYHI